MVYSKWTHVHTLMAGAAVQAANLLIRSSLGLSILFEVASMCSQGGPGTEPSYLPITGRPILPTELQHADIRLPPSYLRS